jgi:hypothetical protein
MGNIIFSESGGVAYSEGIQAIFVDEAILKAKPTTPSVKDEGTSEIAFWGDDNLFPDKVKNDIRKNTILSNGILWKTNALVSGGLVYGKQEYDANGNVKLVPDGKNKEINEFLFNTNIKRFLRETAFEYYTYWLAMPEVILDAGRSKIVALSCNETKWCRFKKDGGKKQLAYINTNWEFGKPTDTETIKVPCIDPYFNPVGQIQKGSGYKFIIPIMGLDNGQAYYPVAPWNSARESGWVDVANEIPKFKKNLMKNQMSIKYHVMIPNNYWERVFLDWKSISAEERKKRKQDEFQTFKDVFSGAEKAGNALFTEFLVDERNGKDYSTWKIEAIKEPMKDGMYIEDSHEASMHIYTALGIDSTLVNTPSKGGLGAGAGSDKREAFNMYMATVKPDQDLILEPLEIVKRYNGWDDEYVFWFQNYYLSTLNQVTPSKRNTNDGTV